MSKQRSCHDCKYLIEDDVTESWDSVGEKNYFCDNEKAVFDGYAEFLDPDCMEDYPDTCTQFCSKAIAARAKV